MHLFDLLLSLLLVRSSCQGSLANLEGVPEHLKTKILSFHRTLEAPDNFTAPAPAAPAPPRRRYQLAGLQEVGPEAAGGPTSPRPSHDLQSDLMRFSGRLTSPAGQSTGGGAAANIYTRMLRSRERKKQRLEREWRKFLQWRKKQRKRKKMRKRIMKMLKRKIEKRFGPLTRARWNTFKQNTAFKDKKKIIRQKIRARIRETKQNKKMKGGGGGGGRRRRRKLAAGRRRLQS